MSDLTRGRRCPLKGAQGIWISPVTCSLTFNELVGWFVVAFIIVGSLGLFFFFVQPSRVGENNLRIGADSAFYLWHAGINRDNPYGDNDATSLSAISIGSNYLGPDIIGTLMRTNFLIFCFNYLLFFAAIACIAKSLSV